MDINRVLPYLFLYFYLLPCIVIYIEDHAIEKDKCLG
jgi:hypothetical protein